MSLSRTFVFPFLAALLALGLSSCTKDSCQAVRTVQIWEPVYQAPEEFRKPIEADHARELKNPGKIYVFGDVLFINELEEGIHIIDNSDPTAPVSLSFLPIPGNVDMAVKDGMLYADHYMDLVAIDISDPRAPVYAGRSTDVFPQNYYYYEDLGFLVDFEMKEVEMEVGCDEPDVYYRWHDNSLINSFSFDSSTGAESLGSSQSGGPGVGGSMARFTIAGDHLYVVNEYDLRVFDLAQPTEPALANTVNIGWGIETIFPYGNQLFIGSRTGMFIYDRTDPLAPTQLAVFEHANACDPVFVSGNLAYVTLRDGTDCQNFINQLEVVDISELTNPRLLATYPMHRPHGLSVVDGTLFICEDDQGLKVFDASEWDKIGERMLAHLNTFNAYDIIALPAQKLALVVGRDGLYQFDFSDPANLEPLSVIPLGR